MKPLGNSSFLGYVNQVTFVECTENLQEDGFRRHVDFNLLVNSRRQPGPAGQKDQFTLTCLERHQCTQLLIRQQEFVFVSPWKGLIPDVLKLAS